MLLDPYCRSRSRYALPSGLDWSELRIQLQSNPITSLDFFQFPPISGPPLWKDPRTGNNSDLDGKMIWQRFKDVVILDEQMRQAQDPEFRSLLGRARAGSLTNDDLDFLNGKVVTSLF